MNKYIYSLIFCGLSSLSPIFSEEPSYNKSSHSSTKPQSYSVITPSVSPVVKDGYNLFVDLDFIYWTAREDSLSFANISSIGDTSRGVNNATRQQGRSLFVNNKYSPGFKIGAGTLTDHDGWDLYLEYTWFRTHPSASSYNGKGSPNIELFNSLFFRTPAPEPINYQVTSRTATANWCLLFNNFDLELGRNFFVSHYLTLRPHFGLKGGWQNQKLNSFWRLNNPVNDDYTWISLNYDIYVQQKQWNIGLRSGLDTSWLLTKNWSFFGNAALATLWNEFQVSRVDNTTTRGSLNPEQNVSNIQVRNHSERSHILSPVFEIALGLKFQTAFSEDRYKFSLKAGWENQVWFYQNNFDAVYSTLTNNTNSTNLNLQGLTLEARLDF